MFCLKKRQKLKNQLRLHNLKKKQKIVAVQANNLSTIKIDTDTTFLLCLEAQRRGFRICLLYTSPSPRDRTRSRMPSSA